MLSLDWNLLWTCLNLVIFYILMKKFVWKKILSVMDQRKAMIDKQFQDAEDAVQHAHQLKSDYEGKLAGVGEESSRLIADAKVSAKARADRIVSQAQKTSDKLVKDARETIEMERQDAMRSAKKDIASLALEAAAKVVGKEAAQLDNGAMFDEFLQEEGGGDPV